MIAAGTLLALSAAAASISCRNSMPTGSHGYRSLATAFERIERRHQDQPVELALAREAARRPRCRC